MGMTIEEASNILEEVKELDDSMYLHNKKYLESLNVALNTMRKYQKIKEIAKEWELDSWTDNLSYESMVQIREVLENGNDD